MTGDVVPLRSLLMGFERASAEGASGRSLPFRDTYTPALRSNRQHAGARAAADEQSPSSRARKLRHTAFLWPKRASAANRYATMREPTRSSTR